MDAGAVQMKLMLDISNLASQMQVAQRVMDMGISTMEKGVDSIRGKLTGFVGAFAAGLSLGVFNSLLQDTIKAQAGLHDLAIQGQTTVEALSGLASIGKFSDTAADSIVTAMNKLTKNLTSATEESKGTGKAIQALGVDLDNFKRMAPEEQMMAVAKAMDGFADGSGKAAVAMALYGKEGAKMLPFLNDLAAAGELQAKVTTEQANAADDLDDNMLRLKTSGDAWKKSLVSGMIPALSLTAQAYVDVFNGAGGVREEMARLQKDGTITEWTTTAITGLTYVADMAAVVARGFKTIGMGLGGYAAAMMQALNGDFSGALQTVKRLGADLGDMWADQTMGQQLRARMAQLAAIKKTVEEKPKLDASSLGLSEKQAKAAKEEQTAYASLNSTLQQRLALMESELAAGRQLTESEKFVLEMTTKLADEKNKLTTVERARLQLLIDYAKVQGAAVDQLNRDIAASKKATEETQARAEALYTLANATEEKLKAQRLENDAIGKTALELAVLERARLQDNAASYEAMAVWYESVGGLDEQAAAARRTATAMRELGDAKVAGEGRKLEVDQWKSIFDSIENAAHETWTNVLQGGQDIWSKLRNTAKAVFFDWLYQMALKKWLINVGASVTGLSASTLAGAAQGANATGGIGSLLSSVSSIAGPLGTVTSALSTFGNAALASTQSLIGMTGTSAQLSTAFSQVAVETGLAASGTSAALTLGQAVPYVAAAYAAYKIISSMTGGETRSGAQFGYHAATGIDLAVSPSGGETAGLRDGLTATIGSINALLHTLGSAQSVAYFTGGAESSKNGKGFSYAGGVLSNNVGFGTGLDGQGYLQNRGSKSVEQATAEYVLELKQATVEALQAAGDLPKAVQDYLAGIDAKTLGGDAADAILADVSAFAALQAQLKNWPFQYLQTQSVAASAKLLTFAGSMENLSGGLGTVYDKFYTSSEKSALLTKQTGDAFAAIGITMPAVGEGTRVWYRGLLDTLGAQDLSIDANAKAYWGTVQLATAVDQLAPATTDAAKALADNTAAVASWQEKIDLLTGKTTQRQIDMTSALASTTDLATKALIREYYAKLDAKDATDAITEAYKQQVADVNGMLGDFNPSAFSKMLYDAAFNRNSALTASQAFGQALGESVKSALLSSTLGQVSQAIFNSIIIPVASGAAVSQATMDAVFADAQAKLTALANMFNSPAFQQLLKQITDGISKTVLPTLESGFTVGGGATTGAGSVDTSAQDRIASERAQIQNELNQYTKTAVELAREQRNAVDAANQALYDQLQIQKTLATRQDWQNKIDVLEGKTTDRALQLQAELKKATDDTVKALISEYYAQLDLKDAAEATARALQANVDSTGKATDKAMAALQRAVDAQKKIWQATADSAQAAVTASKGVIDYLTDQLKSLYGDVSSTAAMQAGQGQAFIDAALASGIVPDKDALQTAVEAVRKSMVEANYATHGEFETAQLVLAGQLAKLKTDTSSTLTVQEQQLKAAQQQLEALDKVISDAQGIIDQLRGNDTSILSVKDAINAFAAAWMAEKAATAQVTATGTGGTSTATAALAAQQQELLKRNAGDFASINFKDPDALTTAKLMAGSDFPNIFVTATSALSTLSGVAASSLTLAGQAMKALLDPTGAGISASDRAAYGLGLLSPEKLLANAGIQSFDVGINRVPYDMLAMIHQGERIMPAADNDALFARLAAPPVVPQYYQQAPVWAANDSTRSSARLEAIAERMADRLDLIDARLEEIEKYDKNTSDTMDRVTQGNQYIQTRAA